MNNKSNGIFRLGACLAVCALLPLTVLAQNVQIIYTFPTNADGFTIPCGSLQLAPDGSFYGTTVNGGTNNVGSVFRVTTNGQFITLASFGGSNGEYPDSGLTGTPDGIFYGATEHGGTGGYGTLYEVTTNGDLTTLVALNDSNGDGADPIGSLTLGSDYTLYGTASGGGLDDFGTIFELTLDGQFGPYFYFYGLTTGYYITTGFEPRSGLTEGSDGTFYGTTEFSAEGQGSGTIFSWSSSTLSYTTLVNFEGTNGAYPTASLTLGNDGNLYGSTFNGGISNYGTIFQVTPGGGFTTLVYFNGTNGSNPGTSLTLGSDGNFYGTTSYGGAGGGTIFRMTTNGALTTLVVFNGTNGAVPQIALTSGLDGNYYGATSAGGSNLNGVIYRLNIPPLIETNSPANVEVGIGGAAGLGATVFGTAPYSYQWFFNGKALPGAHDVPLVLQNLTPTQSGIYTLVVSNQYGTATDTTSLLVGTTPIVTRAGLDPFGNVEISALSSTNATSRVWETSNLAPPVLWLPVFTNFAGGAWQFTDTNLNLIPQRYYRVSTP
jgi:uncharacterized repeat protein (TIGR03803 family)